MPLTVFDIETAIRASLNEPTQARIISAEILQAINDGYKDVASKAFCIENKDATLTVAGNRLVPFSGERVNFIEYPIPQTFGYNGFFLGLNGTYGMGLYVVVKDDSIATSPHLHNWLTQENWDIQQVNNVIGDGYFMGVAWNRDIFCAVGTPEDDENYHGMVFTSPDGAEWTQRFLPDVSRCFYGIISGNNMFCAVGPYGDLSALYAATSTDGKNWTDKAHALPAGETYGSLLAVAFGNGVFCATGLIGTSLSEDSYGFIERSTDNGETWNIVNLPVETTAILAILWLDDRFCAVGLKITGGNYDGVILMSPDGETWTLSATIPSIITFGIAYNGSDIVVFAEGGVVKSTDRGLSWEIFPPDEFFRLLQLFEPPMGGDRGLLKIRPEICGYATNINNCTPQYWFPWGNSVVIEPVPDDAYPLQLLVSDHPASALSLETDCPVSLPAEFQQCIVDFACYVLSIKLTKWGQAVRFYNSYINNIEKRRKEYIERKAEKRAIHHIPGNVTYKGGSTWAH